MCSQAPPLIMEQNKSRNDMGIEAGVFYTS